MMLCNALEKFHMPLSTERVRLVRACGHCREKKVKCDGSLPCGNCLDRDHHCSYPPSQRRGRKYRGKPVSNSHNQMNMPTLIQQPGSTTDDDADPTGGAIDQDRAEYTAATPPMRLRPTVCQTSPPERGSVITTEMHGSNTISAAQPAAPQNESHLDRNRQRIWDQTQEKDPPLDYLDVDREEATIDLQTTHINWEHHGPGSWLSICSELGVRWVNDRVGNSEYRQIARCLIGEWTEHLTIAHRQPRDQAPDLDVETAWRYSTAFFEYSHDAALGIVYRPEFENHLRLHFQDLVSPEDVASYALRNAVYAVGCRAAALMDGDRDFNEVQRKSSRLFFNALSVYTDLLFMPSGLKAVQALIVMTSFAELLGSPAVEYMLCTTAARLAQSKGLHRQPSKAWGLSMLETLHRKWTFWAVYCCDKYIALRSGRPSMIDDDDVSCDIPNAVPIGSTIDLDVFIASIKHAQICSRVAKQFYSPIAFKKSPETLFEELKFLETELESWQTSLPEHLRPSSVSTFAHLTSSYRSRVNIVRLHSAYYGSIIAMHAIFHYPWICSRFLNSAEAISRERILQSSARAAEASRQILMSLNDWVPNMCSTSPVAFFYPMLAIINLFIYILKFPERPTTYSDMALLDIGTGHFGQIYHLTSSRMAVSFPRKVTELASKVVKKAHTEESPATEPFNTLTPGSIFGQGGDTSILDTVICMEGWNSISLDFMDVLSATGDVSNH